MHDEKWQFWVDRGGTFTDIISLAPNGETTTLKLLSENPEQYPDAVLEGIRQILGIAPSAPIPSNLIRHVKMGTTIATNALLERKGERTALVITKGFADALRIGYQNRPHLFKKNIQLPEMCYDTVIEVQERINASGKVKIKLDKTKFQTQLTQIFEKGIRSIAIVFLHSYRFNKHELIAANIARQVGFTQISLSHETSPLIKLISRGDTTVMDAYLSPVLHRYIDRIVKALGNTQIMLMRSSGGLTTAQMYQGKDSILSGPAGGVIGMGKTANQAGFNKVIGFDMGGTSTDVSHYDGVFEHTFDTNVAGIRIRAPMMHIHTIAAGGGSILHFDNNRFRIGPDSAGANPGPACYRLNGPLTVTDCNVMLGKIQPGFFPNIFGPGADQQLDENIVHKLFEKMTIEIAAITGREFTPTKVAEGFLHIAVENMANAIKKISIEKGHDVTEYTLNCFGGAGGQHACLVADALGVTSIFIHPFAGVLSAYGMGLADTSAIRTRSIETELDNAGHLMSKEALNELTCTAIDELAKQDINHTTNIAKKIHLRYQGTDTSLVLEYAPLKKLKTDFESIHQRHFGFIQPGHKLIIEAVSVEAIGKIDNTITAATGIGVRQSDKTIASKRVTMTSGGISYQVPVYDIVTLGADCVIKGPAIIFDTHSTIIVEPDWKSRLTTNGSLVLERHQPRPQRETIDTCVDPIMLEVFNNWFMSIAEQMGVTLAKTASSINIKERLDFSCAIFDRHGNLVANAPHIPVHLGSMGESVKAVINHHLTMQPGDVFAINAPYNGGTHLPDITVVTPVFEEYDGKIIFFVAARGHHADLGGITPGSMPPNSTAIHEEGVLFNNIQIVHDNKFLEQKIRQLLVKDKFPARNPDQNIADLRAQIAANEKGVIELKRMAAHFSLPVVEAYMKHVQDNAEEMVRRVINTLSSGKFAYSMDDGSEIKVAIRTDQKERKAIIDFTGTSPQRGNNFNAPLPVCWAAVLYVFRTLIDDDIPLNAGCLKPIEIIAPEGCMLNPVYPAAVVAGNVETSQCITDALYGALGVMAAAQGSMNNFTFGNDQYQYYETICGGAGAGPDFDGQSAVHTHMTNSRMTDPEILESRFPVSVESFSIRKGSGGNGHHKGGDGVIRRIRFHEKMHGAILSNHRRIPPFGLQGGENAMTGQNWIEHKDGTVTKLGSTANFQLESGDIVVIETPGGGGYGKISD